jgi:hypothetical protein
MGLDRAFGRAQRVGDLLVGLAANNQLEDFALARGQFRDMSERTQIARMSNRADYPMLIAASTIQVR